MRRLALLVLLLPLISHAKDKKTPEGRIGTLLDTTTQRRTRLAGNQNGVMELRNDQAHYEIDDGVNYVYVVRRSMTE